MKTSLRMKLIISYLVISILLVLSLLISARVIINREFTNYVKDNQLKNSNGIVNQIIAAYQKNGSVPEDEIFSSIGEAALEKGLILRIFSKDGELLWCMDCNSPERCGFMLSGMEHNMNQIYSDFAGQYVENAYEIEFDNEGYGTVVLGYYGPFFYNSADVHFLTMLDRIFTAVALAALIVSVSLGLFMAGRISNPLKKVTVHTKLIEHGNYEIHIDQITNTKEVDSLIQSVNCLADTLNRQKKLRKRLAQDYSHEFRTPLTSLQSNLEAMIDGIWDPDQERLISLNEEVLRLSRMVGKLDTLVEVEEELGLELSSFDLLGFMNQLAIGFETQLQEHQLRLKIIGDPCTLIGDKDKLGQVVINLLSNAIKYTPDLGIITVELTNKDNEVILKVKDTGLGIEAEDIPYVFEHLYRGDKSRSSQTGGNGIGLAVVKAIVKAHGGSVTAESELEKGSTFTIRLPKKL